MTKDITIPVEQVKEKVSNALTAATEMAKAVRSDVKYEEANGMLVNIKKVGKLVEQEKKKQLDPANATVKAIREFWKPFEEQVLKAEAILKESIIKYKKQIDARNAQKEATISNKVQSGEMSFEEGVKKIEKSQTPTTHSGLKTKTYKNVKYAPVNTLTAEELVLLAKNGYIDWANKSAIRSAVLAGAQVPGTEVVEEETLSL